MKSLLLSALLLLCNTLHAQTQFPTFLQGTWKVTDKNIYEHWDVVHDQLLKGFSYQFVNGHIKTSEYLEIKIEDNKLIYTATVIGQNEGKSIVFTQTHDLPNLVFENLDHDFPKQISYQLIGNDTLAIQLSDRSNLTRSFLMTKQAATTPTTFSKNNPNYDEALAQRLGGDDYGMKSYYLVILTSGKQPTSDTALIRKSFQGHLANINSLVAKDKLVVAGPLGKNEKNYRGIFIFHNLQNAEEVKNVLQTDPAIHNGLLDYEIFSWYGSAALPEYLPVSDKIWKLKP